MHGGAVGTPAPAPAPVAKQPLLVVFAPEGGNAEALAGKAKKEAAKQGFKRALVPEANKPRRGAQLEIEVIAAKRLDQALSELG